MATPNMNLTLPIPNITSGTWGTTLNADFTAIDAHDHTAGKGVLVPVSGISATGVPNNTTFLRGDGAWQVPSSTYSLPIATSVILGGVKQGSNVTIDGAGVLSVAAPYTLPIASATLGGVKSAAGTGVTIDGAGVVSVPADVRAYDMMFAYAGIPTANKVMARIIMVRPATLDINSAGSRGVVGVNPTAAATILVQRNGATIVTISVTIGGVFSFANAGVITFAAGDVVTLVAQAVPDTTMADISITLAGALVV